MPKLRNKAIHLVRTDPYYTKTWLLKTLYFTITFYKNEEKWALYMKYILIYTCLILFIGSGGQMVENNNS